MTHPKRKLNIYNSIQRAVARHWSITLSSDGYANYGTGNQITSDNTGPHGFANPNAWCVLSKTITNQQYQFCIQTDGYMGFRIKYSKLGFNSGMDNLGTTPSAIDQQILVGSGTDVAPTYQQILDGTFNFNISKVVMSITTSTSVLKFNLTPKVILKPIQIPPFKPTITKVLK